jgi:hypothetical protein
MPASSLVRAAFFALGAAVGGGAVAALNASKKREAADPGLKLPIVEVGVAGDPRLAVGPVLKYGNPGAPVTAPDLSTHSYHRCCYAGPISDQLVRQAYVAAYDRRMRHPAWVSIAYVLLKYYLLLLTKEGLDGRTFDTRFSREISPRGQRRDERKWRSRKFDF